MIIKTEIEWFDPRVKLPPENQRLLMVDKWDDFYSATYCDFSTTFTTPEDRIGVNKTKYWAYLPILQEIVE